VAEDFEPIECRCYTLPHRHPLMIGKLPGFQLPFMVTVTQFAVFSIGAPFLFFTRGQWGLLVSGQAAPELLVIVGIPAGAAWALRLARMEGRSPLAMGLGWYRWAGPGSAPLPRACVRGAGTANRTVVSLSPRAGPCARSRGPAGWLCPPVLDVPVAR